MARRRRAARGAGVEVMSRRPLQVVQHHDQRCGGREVPGDDIEGADRRRRRHSRPGPVRGPGVLEQGRDLGRYRESRPRLRHRARRTASQGHSAGATSCSGHGPPRDGGVELAGRTARPGRSCRSPVRPRGRRPCLAGSLTATPPRGSSSSAAATDERRVGCLAGPEAARPPSGRRGGSAGDVTGRSKASSWRRIASSRSPQGAAGVDAELLLQVPAGPWSAPRARRPGGRAGTGRARTAARRAHVADGRRRRRRGRPLPAAGRPRRGGPERGPRRRRGAAAPAVAASACAHGASRTSARASPRQSARAVSKCADCLDSVFPRRPAASTRPRVVASMKSRTSTSRVLVSSR